VRLAGSGPARLTLPSQGRSAGSRRPLRRPPGWRRVSDRLRCGCPHLACELNLGAEARPAAVGTVDHEPAAQGLDAVGEPARPLPRSSAPPTPSSTTLTSRAAAVPCARLERREVLRRAAALAVRDLGRPHGLVWTTSRPTEAMRGWRYGFVWAAASADPPRCSQRARPASAVDALAEGAEARRSCAGARPWSTGICEYLALARIRGGRRRVAPPRRRSRAAAAQGRLAGALA
jgi:hypothetical protein